MKYIGFIKEYDEILEAKSLKGHFQLFDNNEAVVKKVIKYLEKGCLFFPVMEYYNDIETNKFLCPRGYFTDGVWIWPYYLKRHPNFYIPKDFLTFLEAKKFLSKTPKNLDEDLEIDLLIEKLKNKL